MGKPEIIGYRHPDGRELTPSDSVYGGWVDQRHGRVYSVAGPPRATRQRVKQLGFKPIYRERAFHAWPAFGGYRVRCKTCGRIGLIGGDILPHDYAARHECVPRYGTATVVESGSTVVASGGTGSANLAMQLPERDDDDLPCTHEGTWMGKCVACSHEVDEW